MGPNMPVSLACETALNTALRDNLAITTVNSTFHEKEILKNQLFASAKRATLVKVEYEEYKNITCTSLASLKSKYLVLKSSDKPITLTTTTTTTTTCTINNNIPTQSSSTIATAQYIPTSKITTTQTSSSSSSTKLPLTGSMATNGAAAAIMFSNTNAVNNKQGHQVMPNKLNLGATQSTKHLYSSTHNSKPIPLKSSLECIFSGIMAATPALTSRSPKSSNTPTQPSIASSSSSSSSSPSTSRSCSPLQPHLKLSCNNKNAELQVPRLPVPKRILYDRMNIQIGWQSSRKWQIGSGLQNVGNTCYMNSCLQALFHAPAFANWLISDVHHRERCKDISGGNSSCMVCAVSETLISTQSTNTAIKPHLVYNKLRMICKHFTFGQQEDAHEFLRYLMESMEKSYLQRFENFKEFDQHTKETTPINQILGGYLRSSVHCLSCGYVSVTFEHFQDLILDIRKANTIEDALRNHFAIEQLEDMGYKCESCKRKVSATKQFSLERVPYVLCIQLKRFSINGGKLNKQIVFRPCLDLTQYLSPKIKSKLLASFGSSGSSSGSISCTPSSSSTTHGPNSLLPYRLVSMVTHLGHTPNSGHYTAIGTTNAGGYYQFDDPSVHPITPKNVLNTHPYILFYELEDLETMHTIMGETRISKNSQLKTPVSSTITTTPLASGYSSSASASASASSSATITFKQVQTPMEIDDYNNCHNIATTKTNGIVTDNNETSSTKYLNGNKSMNSYRSEQQNPSRLMIHGKRIDSTTNNNKSIYGNAVSLNNKNLTKNGLNTYHITKDDKDQIGFYVDKSNNTIHDKHETVKSESTQTIKNTLSNCISTLPSMPDIDLTVDKPAIASTSSNRFHPITAKILDNSITRINVSSPAIPPPPPPPPPTTSNIPTMSITPIISTISTTKQQPPTSTIKNYKQQSSSQIQCNGNKIHHNNENEKCNNPVVNGNTNNYNKNNINNDNESNNNNSNNNNNITNINDHNSHIEDRNNNICGNTKSKLTLIRRRLVPYTSDEDDSSQDSSRTSTLNIIKTKAGTWQVTTNNDCNLNKCDNNNIIYNNDNNNIENNHFNNNNNKNNNNNYNNINNNIDINTNGNDYSHNDITPSNLPNNKTNDNFHQQQHSGNGNHYQPQVSRELNKEQPISNNHQYNNNNNNNGHNNNNNTNNVKNNNIKNNNNNINNNNNKYKHEKSTITSTVQELMVYNHRGYGTSVNSWTGQPTVLENEVQRDKIIENKRQKEMDFDDDMNDMDRIHFKKMKLHAQNNAMGNDNPGYNPFNEHQIQINNTHVQQQQQQQRQNQRSPQPPQFNIQIKPYQQQQQQQQQQQPSRYQPNARNNHNNKMNDAFRRNPYNRHRAFHHRNNAQHNHNNRNRIRMSGGGVFKNRFSKTRR